ncbi:MAG: hypothetical protein ABI700_05685 [Chloroflexota bacterium]
MGTIKAKWKRAPIDQRRVTSDRTIPNARFARKNLSASLPPSLPNSGSRRPLKPLMMFAGALIVMVCVGITLVIVVGAYLRNEQQTADMEWRAAYYGRPTLPFSTLAPDYGPQEGLVGTTSPYMTTPLPGITNALVSASSAESALTEPDGSSTGDKGLASYCDQFGDPVSIRVFDWNDWSTVDVTNTLVAQLPVSWDASGDLWRGYNVAKPFDQPDDARDRWRLQLFTQDGTERWIQISQSASTPDTLYAYAFQIITPYTDKHGNHYGYHPCRAFSLPYTDMTILLSSARAYQSSGSRFPAFGATDDSRWVRGTASPIAGGFDLRNIPTLANNEPIQTVSQTVSCYFITDAAWGAWAQIKVGNSTAWVDTSTVKLEAAS